MSEKDQAPAQLSAELIEFLQGPQLVLVTTLDAESGWPTNNLITWVCARDQGRLALAADARGRIMANIRADGRLLLTVMAHGACHVIEGVGRVVSEEVPGVSLKLALAEVTVRAVRDITFWGGRITVLPEYDVTYDKALKEKLDSGVFAALKSL